MADSAQLAGLDEAHEARQGLVNGLAAPKIEEVLRRAHPPLAGLVGHSIHDLVGHTVHWITVFA